jgi:WD40 repeat protein
MTGGIKRAMFNLDGRTLISSSDHGLRTWDAETGWELPDRPKEGLPATMLTEAGPRPSGSPSAAFSKDEELAVLTHLQRTIRLLRPTDDFELARIECGDPGGVEWLALSPDGSRLALVTRSGSLQLWDLRLIRAGLAGLNLDWGPGARADVAR